MTWTRASQYQKTITQPLPWSPNQDVGSGCASDNWCVDGLLTPSTGEITFTWYLQPDQDDGCEATLKPVIPALNWLGQWYVQSRSTQYQCTPPIEGAIVTISNRGNQLVMNGGGGTWDLDWASDNLSPAGSCEDYMCTSGSLYVQGASPTATVNWVFDTLYKCDAVLVFSQQEGEMKKDVE